MPYHFYPIGYSYGDVIISLDGVHIFVKLEEYLQLEVAFLEALAEPDVAPVLAELRTLYGDL